MLRGADVLDDIAGKDVILPKEKSYIDNEGNYHKGLKDTLISLEEAIKEIGKENSKETKKLRVDRHGRDGLLRREAARIRAELNRRKKERKELSKNMNRMEEAIRWIDSLTAEELKAKVEEAKQKYSEQVPKKTIELIQRRKDLTEEQKFSQVAKWYLMTMYLQERP